mmetsp:Transcript_18958/g.57271  ORF Transcript_18958/g.57271 Transcript_18958/m.57271 type:complete len:203 (+) Transcript_18958:352-960(+)
MQLQPIINICLVVMCGLFGKAGQQCEALCGAAASESDGDLGAAPRDEGATLAGCGGLLPGRQRLHVLTRDESLKQSQHVLGLVHGHHMPCVQHRCMGEVLRSFNGACDIIIHPPLQTTGGIEGIAATPGQRLGPQVLAQIVADEIFGSSVDEHRQARLQQEGDLGCVVLEHVRTEVSIDGHIALLPGAARLDTQLLESLGII